MMQWIMRLIFLVVVMLAVVILVRTFIVTEVDSFEAEANLLMERIIYSPTIITYYDDTIERAFPGTIDFEKFQKAAERMDRSLSYGETNKHIGAEIDLLDTGKRRRHKAYYNKEEYEKLDVYARSRLKGPGSARAKNTTAYVLIRYPDGSISNGIMQIRVVMPFT